jgi:hypothetical protein
MAFSAQLVVDFDGLFAELLLPLHSWATYLPNNLLVV